MMEECEKPLSEVASDSGDFVEIPAGENRRIVIEVTQDTAIHAVVQGGASLTIIGVGKVAGKVVLIRSISLGKHARLELLLACRVASGASLQCDDSIRLTHDNAHCSIDDRCAIEGNGRAIIRQRVVVAQHVRSVFVSTAIRGMVLGKGRLRTIPELDIASNAVTAKHAVTIARPTASLIAYFASRGIDRSAAESMLADQFLCPISTLV